ncbi:hypothetical protein JMN32_17955 [Fulvivirga sp. 29W222]|uniref:Uncharacterized protein n=1 Tax=Fulvivirga marina TaxID=2494733 RepID=A0A937KD85_9BACT|nr:hypothetical protein [Fulvivirga marina]MBL6448204.1 hypothetical protein [Fulvivirga marina]
MEDLIMAEFEKTNSKPSHVLMMRNLNHSLFRMLNPKQKDEIEPSINRLIDKGFVAY